MISNFFPSILLEPTLQKLSFLVASVTQFLDFLFLDLSLLSFCHLDLFLPTFWLRFLVFGGSFSSPLT